MKQYIKPTTHVTRMATAAHLLVGSDGKQYYDFSQTLPDNDVDAGNAYVGYAKKSFDAWNEWDDEDTDGQ